MNASPDRAALMQQQQAERAKRLRRAVEDVLEGHSVDATAPRRGVPEALLREALRARGWTPPTRLRSNNTRSRAKVAP